MTTEDLIDEVAVQVEGKKDKREVIIFTLSTCMWCKKCKRFLGDRNIKYKYFHYPFLSPLKISLL